VQNDLIVSSYQLYEARAAGAGAVVLTVATLDQHFLTALLECAESLGMLAIAQVDPVVEVDQALEAGARVGSPGRASRLAASGPLDRVAGLLDDAVVHDVAVNVNLDDVKPVVDHVGRPGDVRVMMPAGDDRPC